MHVAYKNVLDENQDWKKCEKSLYGLLVEVDNYPMIPIKYQLGPAYNAYVSSHKAKYASFEEFLTAAGVK